MVSVFDNLINRDYETFCLFLNAISLLSLELVAAVCCMNRGKFWSWCVLPCWIIYFELVGDLLFLIFELSPALDPRAEGASEFLYRKSVESCLFVWGWESYPCFVFELCLYVLFCVYIGLLIVDSDSVALWNGEL